MLSPTPTTDSYTWMGVNGQIEAMAQLLLERMIWTELANIDNVYFVDCETRLYMLAKGKISPPPPLSIADKTMATKEKIPLPPPPPPPPSSNANRQTLAKNGRIPPSAIFCLQTKHQATTDRHNLKHMKCRWATVHSPSRL